MKPAHSRVYQLVIIVGGFALLGAMAVDFIAVIGRQIGMPLLGSIELVQVLIGVSGAVALLVTTLRDSHAVVRLLLANIAPARAAQLQRINHIAAALFLLALAAGSAWILLEMWDGHEETELLQLPLLPLRMLIVATLLVTSGLFLRKLWHTEARNVGHP
jgi:TRAP-type C4-dicarboxylate transport system permease small subunit